MNKNFENIKEIGFDESFIDQIEVDKLNEFEIARVSVVHRDIYIINNGKEEISARLLGKLTFTAESPLDFPAVGDWVLVKYYDDNSLAIIHEIIPRKTILKRKTPGKKTDFQVIAVNIDAAFIIQSLDENFNIPRLERYHVMISEGGIEPIILLSKSDLSNSIDIDKKVNEIKKIMPRLPIFPFSNEDGSGIDDILKILNINKTYCMLGSSGVGKTSLINTLIGNSVYKTNRVRDKDSRGKHTTTERHLIKLGAGPILIDTPGMRELGNFSIEKGITETFDEIVNFIDKCKFKDCSHVNEKGCAVLEALENGLITRDRYNNYMKILKENRFNEMTYFEKRQKDKEFGKMVKSVMKGKKN